MPPPEIASLPAASPLSAGALSPPPRSGTIAGWARAGKTLIAVSGPGYLIAAGYMDPGNWATDLAGGSAFGFALLPVILLSNFAAMFLQRLALRLGIVTGQDLAQLCRERYSPATARFLWVTAQIGIVACDLAEVIGTAIALKLLFHIPIVWGVALTAFDTLLIMGLQKSGMRALEAIVIALIGTVAACFLYEILLCRPNVAGVAASFLPDLHAASSPLGLYLALGIFGATVMPHNLYLHSGLARRFHKRNANDESRRKSIRFATADCFGALTVAVLINAAILITAASAFHLSGHSGVATLEDAYKLLTPALGAGAASLVFAVALLAAGQNSTLTGTMAGQIVMEGFLGLKLSPCLMRLATRGAAVLPALAVAAVAGENATAQLLILSQVVLSLQLGFAVIPLVKFTSDRELMQGFVNGATVRRSGYALAAAIAGANICLILQTM